MICPPGILIVEVTLVDRRLKTGERREQKFQKNSSPPPPAEGRGGPAEGTPYTYYTTILRTLYMYIFVWLEDPAEGAEKGKTYLHFYAICYLASFYKNVYDCSKAFLQTRKPK